MFHIHCMFHTAADRPCSTNATTSHFTHVSIYIHVYIRICIYGAWLRSVSRRSVQAIKYVVQVNRVPQACLLPDHISGYPSMSHTQLLYICMPQNFRGERPPSENGTLHRRDCRVGSLMRNYYLALPIKITSWSLLPRKFECFIHECTEIQTRSRVQPRFSVLNLLLVKSLAQFFKIKFDQPCAAPYLFAVVTSNRAPSSG